MTNLLLKLKAIWPKAPFWRSVLMKIVSLFVSVKVHILTVTTLLLLFDEIGQGTWERVIIAIALGNIVISSVEVYKDKDGPTNRAV